MRSILLKTWTENPPPLTARTSEVLSLLALLKSGSSVIVVGPDGAGKHSILKMAAESLSSDSKVYLVGLNDERPAQWVSVCTPAQLPPVLPAGVRLLAVHPLSSAEFHALVDESATAHGLHLSPEGRDAILTVLSRFYRSTAAEPALRLIQQVSDYYQQKHPNKEGPGVDALFVNKVFSIYSGIPAFVVGHGSLSNAQLRAYFNARLVGQDQAIDQVIQSLTQLALNLNAPDRPAASLLLVGPHGVGRTQLAKLTARFLLGSDHHLTRIDTRGLRDGLSLIQAIPPRTLPLQVLYLEHLEQAPQSLWNALIPLLQTGFLNGTLDLRPTVIIASAHRPAEDDDASFDAWLAQRARSSFDRVALFSPLNTEQVHHILRRLVRSACKREGLKRHNVVVDVDGPAERLLITMGTKANWGAHGLHTEIERSILTPIASRLGQKHARPGQVIKVTGVDGTLRIRRLHTAAPSPSPQPGLRLAGPRRSHSELIYSVGQTRARVEQLAAYLGESGLLEELHRLQTLKRSSRFWQHPLTAQHTLNELEKHTDIIDRIETLRGGCARLDMEVKRDTGSDIVEQRLAQLDTQVEEAYLELLFLGPAGHADALICIQPRSDSPTARNTLTRMYRDWADYRGYVLSWIYEPQQKNEPVILAIKGHYAFGFLEWETGYHTVVDSNIRSHASVRIAPLVKQHQPIAFADHQALKGIGVFGGRIRSRLTCESGLILQNARSLSENQQFAEKYGHSWTLLPAPIDALIRHYDLSAPLVRDVLTTISSGRADAIEPAPFHDLLCKRVSLRGDSPGAA